MITKDPIVQSILIQPENTGERFFALDGLRAISYFLVLIAHSLFCVRMLFDDFNDFIAYLDELPSLPKSLFMKADLALDVFFAFSAFLLGMQLISELSKKQTINSKWYFVKRILRIYPVYILALVLFAIPSIIANTGNYEYFWANLLGVNNLLSLNDIFLVWTWSISAEIQFYVVCPFLAYFAIKHPKSLMTLLFGLVMVSIFWRYYYIVSDRVFPAGTTFFDMFANEEDKVTSVLYFDYIYMHSISRMPAFIFGFIASYFYVVHKQPIKTMLSGNRALSLSLVLLSIVSIIWVFFGMTSRELLSTALLTDSDWNVYYFELIFYRIIFSLGMCLFIVLMLSDALGSRYINKALSTKWLYPVSQTSYAMYLFHPVFLWPPYLLANHFNLLSNIGWIEPVIITFIVFYGSLIFSIYIYKYIEYPFLRGKFYKLAREYVNKLN